MITFDSARRYFSHAYVLRETIPDFLDEVGRWENLGETLEQDLDGRGWRAETLAFGDHPRQDLRLYRAGAGNSPKGLAVFIHGGFWRMMARDQSHFVARPYLERGWDCAVLEYRLMPEFRLDELVQDTAAALALLQAQGPWPSRLLVGHSAGAHLAWHGGLRARADGASSRDDALLLVSPVFDIFAVQSTPIIDELQMGEEEAARWGCFHGFAQADQPVQFALGADETEDFKRQAYMGAQRMGRGEQDNIALVGGCNHLSVMTQLASDDATFEALHAPLGLFT